MSFGFSVGDFVTVGKLAWSVFRSCKAAPGEFQELSKEVSTLHTTLKELEDEASDPQSLLSRRGARRKDELFMIRDNIETALQQLDDIVKRYQSLGRQEKKTWDRVRFAAEDLDVIRGKLVFHTSAISLFLQSLSVGSLGRIEGVLEDLVREVRAGKKEKTLLSACGEEEGDDYDAFAWAELKRELEEEGISGQDIEKYKDAIKIHLKNLVGDNRDGDGEAETTDRASSGSGDWRSDDEWESASQREGLDKIETPYSKDMGPDGFLRARLYKPFADPPLEALEANLLREASPRFARKDETFNEARELQQRTFWESWGAKKSTANAGIGKEDKGRRRKQLSPPPSRRLRHETSITNEAPQNKQNKKESNAASQNLTPPPPKTPRYQSRSGLHWLQSSHTEKKKTHKPDSRFDNKRTHTCSGCYANTRGSESAKLSCGHRLCNRCLKSLFRLSDDDERYMPPICCNQGDHIPLQCVDSLFDNGFKLRWNKKYREKYHVAPKEK